MDLSQTRMPVSCEAGCDCPSCSVLKPSEEQGPAKTHAGKEFKHQLPMSRLGNVTSPSEDAQSVAALGLEALDFLNVGLLVTNSDGRLLRSNRAGQRILQAGKFVSVDGAGMLRTAKGTRPTLADIVRRATEPESADKSDGPHLVTTVRGAVGEHGLTILALKTQAPPEDAPSVAVPLILFSSMAGVAVSPAALNSIFSFTSAESIMANLVLEGLGRNDCGSCLKIRPTTVAFHLKNIFRKTGSRCQAQLISKLFKAIGLIQGACADATAVRGESFGRQSGNAASELEYGSRNAARSVTSSRYLPK